MGSICHNTQIVEVIGSIRKTNINGMGGGGGGVVGQAICLIPTLVGFSLSVKIALKLLVKLDIFFS